MSNQAEEQRRLILDQFTRQAMPFAEMPAHSNDEANRPLIDLAGIGPEDTVLDVACGPGLVACALAEVARHVTGIDLTPAMRAWSRRTTMRSACCARRCCGGRSRSAALAKVAAASWSAS